jgi:sigma-E factor negative regulatory protein RseC
MNNPCTDNRRATYVQLQKQQPKPVSLNRTPVVDGTRQIITVSSRVIKVEEDFIWAEPDINSACTHCSTHKGCGVSTLTTFFGQRANYIRVPKSMNAAVGDEVVLGIRTTALLKGTFLLYLLPLLSMLVSACAMNILSHNEALTALMAGGGLISGLATVRYLAARNTADNTLQPFMLARGQSAEEYIE